MAIRLCNDRWSKSKALAVEPDILAAYQYLKTQRRTGPAAPEKALMFAVLADAIETYQKFAAPNRHMGKLSFVKWQRGFGMRKAIVFSRS
jgi:hypothetical protein